MQSRLVVAELTAAKKLAVEYVVLYAVGNAAERVALAWVLDCSDGRVFQAVPELNDIRAFLPPGLDSVADFLFGEMLVGPEREPGAETALVARRQLADLAYLLPH